MAVQISLFDGTQPFKIDKPIRLIELFAGIGAQAKALENLGVDFEHYRICEFDKYAVKSYNAVHGTDFQTSDITKLKGEDLGIVDTDKYCYVMTYSFPCQDLSNAGNMKGMTKGSGTRSGLLWEVERLLTETKELPQVLVMENVPQVIGQKNMPDFAKWIAFLDGLGYKSKYALLNAKDYGIPQNRERCFMVSILGDYFYEFPEEIPLKKRLKDMLEERVDERFYLSEQAVNGVLSTTFNSAKLDCRVAHNVGITPLCARDYKDPKLVVEEEPKILERFYANREPRVYDEACPTLRSERTGLEVVEPMDKYDLSDTMKRYINSYNDKYKVSDGNLIVNREVAVAKTTREGCTRADSSDYISADMEDNKNIAGMDCVPYRIRKLTPKECWRLMGFTDEDVDKAVVAGISNAQLYKQAGNSIVVQVLEGIFKQML